MLSINPFKKRREPAREGVQQEQFLPTDLERFRVQPAEPPPFEAPEKERKFRAFAQEIGEGSDLNSPITPSNFPYIEERQTSFPQNKSFDISEKIDMVLQKLETIDLRLKLIEQKLERRVV